VNIGIPVGASTTYPPMRSRQAIQRGLHGCRRLAMSCIGIFAHRIIVSRRPPNSSAAQVHRRRRPSGQSAISHTVARSAVQSRGPAGRLIRSVRFCSWIDRTHRHRPGPHRLPGDPPPRWRATGRPAASTCSAASAGNGELKLFASLALTYRVAGAGGPAVAGGRGPSGRR